MADQKGSPPPGESSVKFLYGFPSLNSSASSSTGNSSGDVEISKSVTPSEFIRTPENPGQDRRLNETYVVMPMTSTPKIRSDIPEAKVLDTVLKKTK